MIQPLFEHRHTFAGYETRVLELEGDGVPIVLFHGYADSADTWRLALARIARRGRRPIPSATSRSCPSSTSSHSPSSSMYPEAATSR
jgi:pimeloyl-ACP methyl ester carboxylesterase